MKNFKLDGSEVSWLVYADWLDDQNLNGSWIRETVGWWYFCGDEETDWPVNAEHNFLEAYHVGSGSLQARQSFHKVGCGNPNETLGIVTGHGKNSMILGRTHVGCDPFGQFFRVGPPIFSMGNYVGGIDMGFLSDNDWQ